MTAIWTNDGTTWKLQSPADFPNEAKLHDLIEEAPQMLPLAGNPDIAILGREVQLGSGYADLVGLEPTGRLVVIEVKLARNAEARRAVVSQILAYAAYLFTLDQESLERDVLRSHLISRGWDSLATAGAASFQSAFDQAEFNEGLTECLSEGRFRLVLVIDQAPEELIKLVGYLEAVSDRILMDLITVSSYSIGGSTVIVPQRVDPERQQVESPQAAKGVKAKGYAESGADAFLTAIDRVSPTEQLKLRRLTEWALGLEREGLCQLKTYHGLNNIVTLLPLLRSDRVGLVTVYNDATGYITLYRSVFERRAPKTLVDLEQEFADLRIGKGTICRDVSDTLLSKLTQAYREANDAITRE